MNSVSYPSSRVDGTLVQLIDFVSLLPEQGLIWSILYFQGVGTFPNLTMEDLERLAFEGPKGHVLTRTELDKLAMGQFQTIDLLLVGAESLDEVSSDRTDIAAQRHARVVIGCFDSSEWSLWARDSELMACFEGLLEEWRVEDSRFSRQECCPHRTLSNLNGKLFRDAKGLSRSLDENQIFECKLLFEHLLRAFRFLSKGKQPTYTKLLLERLAKAVSFLENLNEATKNGPVEDRVFVNYLIMLHAWVTLKLEAKPESLAGVELRLNENAFEEAIIKTLILDLETARLFRGYVAVRHLGGDN